MNGCVPLSLVLCTYEMDWIQVWNSNGFRCSLCLEFMIMRNTIRSHITKTMFHHTFILHWYCIHTTQLLGLQNKIVKGLDYLLQENRPNYHLHKQLLLCVWIYHTNLQHNPKYNWPKWLLAKHLHHRVCMYMMYE